MLKTKRLRPIHQRLQALDTRKQASATVLTQPVIAESRPTKDAKEKIVWRQPTQLDCLEKLPKAKMNDN